MADLKKLLFIDASEIETIAEDHFGDQVIGGTSRADAQPEIDFPLRGEVEVHGGKDLVLLLEGGKEIRGRSDGTVIFYAACDFLGEIEAEFHIWRENESLADIQPMQ